MNYDKLTETLRQHGVSCVRAYGKYCSICDEAATALSTLQAKNKKLRSEAEGMRSNWYKSVEKIQKLRAELENYRKGHCSEGGCAAEKDRDAVLAELEQVKRERDAAVKDLNEFLSLDELCPIQCKWCKWENTNCDGKIPEWRGLHKEE